MSFRYALIGVAVLTACTSRQVEVVSGGEVAAVVPANASILPAGTSMQVHLNQKLSTEGNKVGDTFTATVTSNVVAENGEIAVPAGALVHGRITGLDDSDHAQDKALIQIRFDRLAFNNRSYDFGANVTSVATIEQRNPKTGEVVRAAATGAAAGAVLGAIIRGPELDEILKGGLFGAAAGTIISLGMGDVEHTIPAGTRMTIQATQTVALR